MFNFFLDGAADAGATTGGFNWISILGIVAVVVFFYFFMIRPQKKQEKQERAMRDALQVGDEVTTIGGIIGKVVSIKDETFVLETTKDRTKIRFLKAAVRSVDVRVEEARAAKEAADTAEEKANDEK